jgi:hypothetical protein
LHSDSMVVETFLSLILSYFSFLVLACSPCHGRDPLRKYRRTKPIASRSSLLACSNYLSIITTYSQVRVDAGIPCSASQVLPISVGNMFPRFRILKSLGKSKINHVDKVLFLVDANQEIIWLNISV